MRGLLLGLALTGCGRLDFDPLSEDVCTVALDGPAVVNFNSQVGFVASGGIPPYTYAATGVGAIDSSTGMFAAHDLAGDVDVTATDAAGCSAQLSTRVGGLSLFYVGGTTNSVPTDEVLGSEDGLSWSVVGHLPDARHWGGIAVLDNRLLYFGGNDGTVERDEVFASDDGVTWTLAGHLPSPASAFGYTVHQGHLYMVGGYADADNVSVSGDGITWTQIGHLPMDNHGGTLVSSGNTLFYTGGHNGSLFDWVLASPDGITWTQVGTLAVPREYHQVIKVDDARWAIIGGQNLNPTPTADVTSTTDGTTWTAVPPLPVARALGATIVFGGRVWSYGGTNNAAVYSTDGTAPWVTESTSTFPSPRQAGVIARFTPP